MNRGMETETLLQPGWRSERIELSEVELHCIVAGSGPLLIFLHGFPEFWYSWKDQIAEFSSEYTVVVPDLRGFNESSKPDEPAAYELSRLTADTAELIRAFGQKRARIVGHDWGGIIAWAFAEEYPDLCERAAILSIPHLSVFKRVYSKSWRLRAATWHFIFFQLPFLPEFGIRVFDYFSFRRLFLIYAGDRDRVRPLIPVYVDAFRRPGVLKASLNYYRMNLNPKRRSSPRPTVKIRCPVLLLFGAKDKFWTAEIRAALPDTLEYLDGPFEAREIAGAGHWLQMEAPEEVNRELKKFLS